MWIKQVLVLFFKKPPFTYLSRRNQSSIRYGEMGITVLRICPLLTIHGWMRWAECEIQQLDKGYETNKRNRSKMGLGKRKDRRFISSRLIQSGGFSFINAISVDQFLDLKRGNSIPIQYKLSVYP